MDEITGPASAHTSADSEVPKSESVCVAVHVRPLIEAELAEGCEHALKVTPGLPQVGHGCHRFTYDYVFGGDAGRPSWELYGTCVSPLVAGLFQGYNATVFAYGQTGSGKTFTMGSAGFGSEEEASRGVIPRATQEVFAHVAALPPSALCTLRVGFVEIHNEEVRDLLAAPGTGGGGIKIREVPGQGVCLAGATEVEVATREELAAVLNAGTALRSTAATGMNRRSSRSHAIFSITVELRREEEADGMLRPNTNSEESSSVSSYLCAKLHLVDLAGSERVKRTGATGVRLQEGIEINKGLSELGNVINALSEGKAHVPYRNSKLTRMLQDSLGGNSRTIMIACVSPADVNLEESLNTLRYASRARAIRNTPVVNRDPVTAEIAHLRQQLSASRLEASRLRQRLAVYEGNEQKGGGGVVGPFLSPGGVAVARRPDSSSPDQAMLADAARQLRRLQAVVQRAQQERDVAHRQAQEAGMKAVRAEEEKRVLLAELFKLDPAAVERLKTGRDGSMDESNEIQLPETTAAALARVAELENQLELMRRKVRRSVLDLDDNALGSTSSPVYVPHGMRRRSSDGRTAAKLLEKDDDVVLSDDNENGGLLFPEEDEEEEAAALLLDEFDGDGELDAQEAAHASEVASVQSQIRALQSALDSKQRAMAAVSGHAALRQAFSTQLAELAAERDELARERLELHQRLVSLAHESEEERARLSAAYRARIAELDNKLKGLGARERRIRELERLKARAEETCARLERDIGAIRAAKVALQRRAEMAAREHVEWKKARDRELQALRKEGRAAAANLNRLQALSAKQQAVLRRKTEEAEAARRRLKDLEGKRRQISGGPSSARGADGGQMNLKHGHIDTTIRHHQTSALAEPQAPTTIVGARQDGPHSDLHSNSNNPSSALSFPPELSTACDPIQPNALAPLLRDEKARQDWVRQELERCAGPDDLHKQLARETAERSKIVRRLRAVETRLAALRHPAWWPQVADGGGVGCSSDEDNDKHEGASSSLSNSGIEAALQGRKRRLMSRRDACSREIGRIQEAVLSARLNEERRGAGALDAKRWAGVRSASEARTLLRSVFRAAASATSEVAVVRSALAEASEEVELLRLRLEAAEQDKMELALQCTELHGEQRGKEQGKIGGTTAAASSGGAVQQGLQWAVGEGPSSVISPVPDTTDRAAEDLLAQLEAAIDAGDEFDEDEQLNTVRDASAGAMLPIQAGSQNDEALVVAQGLFSHATTQSNDAANPPTPSDAMLISSADGGAISEGPSAQRRKRSLFLSRTGPRIGLSSPARSAASTPGSHSLEVSELFSEDEGRSRKEERQSGLGWEPAEKNDQGGDENENPVGYSSAENYSGDESDDDVAYSPSLATPAVRRRKRKGSNSNSTGTSKQTAFLLCWLNAWQAVQGRPIVDRLTVDTLRETMRSYDGAIALPQHKRAQRKADLLVMLERLLERVAIEHRPLELGGCKGHETEGTSKVDNATPPNTTGQSPGAADYLKQSEEARTRAATLKAAIEEQLRKPAHTAAIHMEPRVPRAAAAVWRPAGAVPSPRRTDLIGLGGSGLGLGIQRTGSESGAHSAAGGSPRPLMPSPRANVSKEEEDALLFSREPKQTTPTELVQEGRENLPSLHAEHSLDRLSLSYAMATQNPRRASEGAPDQNELSPGQALTAKSGEETAVSRSAPNTSRSHSFVTNSSPVRRKAWI